MSSSNSQDQTYSFGPINIHASHVFATTPLSFAFVNLKPVVPGHVLVSPKRVVKRFADLTADEISDLWTLVQKVGKVVEPQHKATSLTLAIQDGPAAGQTVPTVHVHVLPRKAGDFEKNDDVYDAIDAASKSGIPSSVSSASMYSSSTTAHRPVARQGYVGDASEAAREYHCQDFAWEDIREEAEAVLERRRREAAQRSAQAGWTYDAGSWEEFHARENSTARFYKERRYLLLEFPVLTAQQPPQHFLEIGCGCGSSLLPVLKANPTCRVTAIDLSPTAVGMFKAAAAKVGIAAERYNAFACNAANGSDESAALRGLRADAVLLIFTLAALAPEAMPAMLASAYKAVKPGGLLLVRDHGLYDLTQLRIPADQQIEERLYRRLDGTTCYFFSREDLRSKVEQAGFETVECDYACTIVRNRKRALDMKRVFVHGVFRRPTTA
ncbi:hypothetical protein WJX72_006802 [[Myrmecia] bisecta]|uniref:Bis(5'-adenosyl)-triphosphatase n=1 Tax=[Myrmecia] bisecta TaxID=41462 RepID=A0AAW1QS77_9CHLO